MWPTCFLTKVTSGITELFLRQGQLSPYLNNSKSNHVSAPSKHVFLVPLVDRRGKTPTTRTVTQDAVETMILLTYVT